MNMYGLKLKFALLAIATALTVTGGGVAAVTTPAHAAEVAAPSFVAATVRYDDLNLRTAAGVERLNARVRAAADRLCVGSGVESLEARLAGIECRDALIAAAAPQIRKTVQGTGSEFAEASALTLARGR